MPKSHTRKKTSPRSRPLHRSGAPTLTSIYDQLYVKPIADIAVTPMIKELGTPEYLPAGSRILDLGSGVADALSLARQGHHVTAFDLSPIAVDKLNRYAKTESLTLEAKIHDIRLGLPDETYDMVMLLAVSHHLTDTEFARTIEGMKTCTRPGGYNYLRFMDRNAAFSKAPTWTNGHFVAGEEDIRALYCDWEVSATLTDIKMSEGQSPVPNSYSVGIVRRPTSMSAPTHRGSGPTAF